MKTKHAKLKPYTVFGILFAAIGAIMAIIAATAWHTGESLMWQVIIYALINLLASYGFLTRSTWLLPVFAATMAGLVVLSGIFLVQFGMGSFSPVSLVKLAAVGGILWFLYKTRRHLRAAPHDVYVGGLFIALLLGTMSYTALTVLS